VTVSGTVARVDWQNPHIYIYVDAKDDQGKVAQWKFEGYPPNMLVRQGWKKDTTMKAGDCRHRDRLACAARSASGRGARGDVRRRQEADGGAARRHRRDSRGRAMPTRALTSLVLMVALAAGATRPSLAQTTAPKPRPVPRTADGKAGSVRHLDRRRHRPDLR
jgi:hypothetical protein